MERTYSLEDIDAVAAEVLGQLPPSPVVAFHGAMGVGKTTFIRALCAAMGSADTVSSPTFALINAYTLPAEGGGTPLYHLDLYRLSGEEEAVRAGIEDCLYSGAPCLVEWPEKAEALLPAGSVHIRLSMLADGRRHLVLSQDPG